MEWPGDLGAEIALIPRGHRIGDVETQYGFVGMYHGGLVSDGMNEHGVAASALWLDSSQYAPEGDGAKISDLLNYVLGNTKSVEEAIAYIQGQSFYQKDAGADKPDWVPTVAIESEGRRDKIHYYLANDLAGLLYLAMDA